ncbi:MAG TPA: hypothetical protein VGL59_15515 [Polyangia bacterium]|jgi:hypothetical protein
MARHVPAVLAAIALATVGASCSGNSQSGSGNDGGAGGASVSPGTGGNPIGGSTGSGGAIATGGDDGSGGAPVSGNGFDNGMLFPDAGPAVVPVMDAGAPSDGSAMTDGTSGGGMAAVKMFPTLNITLAFTPKGADVTMVATHKGCNPITVEIHGGYSCDNAQTQGGIWDGGRGSGITGPVVCNAQQIGTMTYTRSGSDPALNWTVGDHAAKTDVTYHPIFVDGNCVTFF